MQVSFKDRRVVVAGGSRGIGRAIALGFAAAGADVSVCARGADGLAAVKAEIEGHGVKAHVGRCNLADGAEIARYVAEAEAALGGIDILVNNASAFGRADADADWEASFAVDILATVRAIRAAASAQEASATAGWQPAILNISSIAALQAAPRHPPYAATKAAVIQYTATHAAAVAGKGIRVNCIAPGSIEFPGGSWEQRRSTQPALYEKTLASIPFGRFGTPEEIAHVALFLCSPLASWVTGQTLTVDGGQMLTH